MNTLSKNLDDVVREAVNNFVNTGEAFTALDVSNEVKKTLPNFRHREIQPVVVAMFSNFEMPNYDRTTIICYTSNGSPVEAVCYHHVSDAHDLDNKYPMSKRSQSTTPPVKNPGFVTTPALPVAATASSTPSVSAVSGNAANSAQSIVNGVWFKVSGKK